MKSFLMPGGLRPLGIVFSIAGMLLLILKYKFNFKPDFLNFKVFAFYSVYIEAKSFIFITHQMIEELGGVLLISGLFLIAFTREKVETEILEALRLRAFYMMAYLNFVFLLFAILFFYGFGFVGALTVFTFFWLAAYTILFRVLIYRTKLKNDSFTGAD